MIYLTIKPLFNIIPFYSFFDDLFKKETEGDKKIDEGKKKLEKGDSENGQADILEGTAQKIRESEEKNN